MGALEIRLGTWCLGLRNRSSGEWTEGTGRNGAQAWPPGVEVKDCLIILNQPGSLSCKNFWSLYSLECLEGKNDAATMRLNQNTMLLGKKVVLVPYTSEHVPRYHEWMKSEELQRLTASEPLTLEQEYAMQRSWREDADKCTFIVLDAEKWQAQPGATEESCMVGDVNLFLTDLEDPTLGEIEVMIAGMTTLGLTKFEAKIGQENEPSIRMFQKLHFEQVAASSVFQEVTLRLTVSESEHQWLLEQTSHVEEKPYRDGSAEPC
nr:PREDICTED: N-acetyltransferase 9 isoform X4 [Macaca fascicularis]